MNIITFQVITFLLFGFGVCGKLTNIFFPFYNFSMHNSPVVFKNKTKLGNEMKYYAHIKKISLFHVVGSSITSLVVLTSFSYLAPLPLGYWGYHVYMNHKASHMEQQCSFIIVNDDYRFKKSWHEKITIPEVFFNPVVFLFLIYVFSFFLFFQRYDSAKNVGRGILYWIFILLLFLYSYSFIQTIIECRTLLLQERDFKRREIKWKCHLLRMTFWQRIKKTIFSFMGIQTDGDGYVLNEECKQLEMDLYKSGYSIIDIFYKTLIRPKITIIREIFNSISLINKIFIISLSIFGLFIKHLFKKKNECSIQEKTTKY